ncbi:MAG: succinylglutamate desuccinylase/aspartoacylase family protein [Candidatus Thiodiazotropha sp. (ex Notomyrtea botanica)]|nr:succinylglutamate desuccinylase/aspartoacylase family protein [Candidatus Thiodiazotropha sp. (ex Notomyrtea botanica)]
MLQQLDYLPQSIVQLAAHELTTVLSGPSLIHLPGRRPDPLFVSVLMHGNETVGWEAVRRLLARYGQGKTLPRAMSLFIGNISAAEQGLRRLPGQPDYNRVWPGSEERDTPEHQMMSQVVEIMRQRKPFASIDVHNNTGFNPHYACVNQLGIEFLHLALLFGRTVVYFLRPTGVQSMAFAKLCPAVTLECGKVGQAHGVAHAEEYLDACLHLSEHPQHSVSPQDIDLFHTVARVTVSSHVDIGFVPDRGDIIFEPDLDRMNFQELPPGTPLGRINGAVLHELLDVRDEEGREVISDYFSLKDGQLCLSRPVMPSMLTKNIDVIRQDCLCYLMERYGEHLKDSQ